MHYIDLSTKETQAQACEEVYYLCEKGQSTWRYELVCPKCGKPVTIFLPQDGSKSRGGKVPSCPFCGGYSISIRQSSLPGMLSRHGEIVIEQLTMGGGSVFPDYVIYPQVEGEIEEERKSRLVAFALEDCADVLLLADEQKRVVEQIYDRNPNVLHMAKEFFQVLQSASGDAERTEIMASLESLALTDNANAFARSFGRQTRQTSSASGLLVGDAVSMNALLGNALQPVPEAIPSGTEPRRFCSFCGAVVTGKFCTECGTPAM